MHRMSCWLYKQERTKNAGTQWDDEKEKTIWNVGYERSLDLSWVTVETYTDRDSAQAAVNYLNGGTGAPKWKP